MAVVVADDASPIRDVLVAWVGARDPALEGAGGIRYGGLEAEKHFGVRRARDAEGGGCGGDDNEE